MVDDRQRHHPRPDENVVRKMLEKDGFEDTDRSLQTVIRIRSPFVNSEETGYLVIEDKFPNGRPPIDSAGTSLTDRETVDKVEKDEGLYLPESKASYTALYLRMPSFPQQLIGDGR